MQQPKYPQDIVNPGIITYVKMREEKKRLIPDRTPLSCRVKMPQHASNAPEAVTSQYLGSTMRSPRVCWRSRVKAPIKRSRRVEKDDKK
jgi:hypothetical protein